MRIPAELKPEEITVLVDTREQAPWDLSPMQTERATLTTGDYTIGGLEHVVCLERKSLPDLVQCAGKHRDRFDRVVNRMLAYPARALIVESTCRRIESGDYDSKVHPNAVIGSLLGWTAMGLPVVMAGNRRRAAKYGSQLLLTVARRRWRELREMARSIPPRSAIR